MMNGTLGAFNPNGSVIGAFARTSPTTNPFALFIHQYNMSVGDPVSFRFDTGVQIINLATTHVFKLAFGHYNVVLRDVEPYVLTKNNLTINDIDPGGLSESITWAISPVVPSSWTSMNFMTVGQTLKFIWSGSHNLYLEDNTATCTSTEELVGFKTGVTRYVTFHMPGIVYFICTPHCSSQNMKLSVNIIN
jgi:hypothetical protein